MQGRFGSAPIRRVTMTRNSSPIPEALVPLQQQFQQFRATHPPRSRLPDEFWTSATELAKQHGLYTVAHALRLDYVGLKKRMAGSVRRRHKPARPPADSSSCWKRLAAFALQRRADPENAGIPLFRPV